MSRLVVVSNRVPAHRSKAGSGGLAVALKGALIETGGLWFGWSGRKFSGGDGKAPQPEIVETEGMTLATVDLPSRDYAGYYNGYANRTLWPLLHNRLSLTTFDSDFYAAYRRVNRMFAQRLEPLLTADDAVWVHDYHLIDLGQELRQSGVGAPLGFFLHVPFPPAEVLLALPWHAEMIRALCAYDLVGFQTRRDYRNFRDFVVNEFGGEQDGDIFYLFGRRLRAGVYGVGIDVEGFTRMAQRREVVRRAEALRADFADGETIIGVDRLDYTKGVVERLNAFESLLENCPDQRRRVRLMQVSAPSREEVPEYETIREALELTSGHINGKYAEFDWVPVSYLNQSFSQKRLVSLYRASRIGLVTPLRDGMNLVAKEYVASQDPENPGVLVLSRFAGAAEELHGALIVNPYDTGEVADALRQGLEMPLAERLNRWRTMMANLRRSDIAIWRRRFTDDLAATRRSLSVQRTAA